MYFRVIITTWYHWPITILSQTNEVWRVWGLMGDWVVPGVSVSELLRWDTGLSVSYGLGTPALRDINAGTRGSFLTPTHCWWSQHFYKQIWVMTQSRLCLLMMMEAQLRAKLVSVTNSNLTWRQVRPALARSFYPSAPGAGAKNMPKKWSLDQITPWKMCNLIPRAAASL